VVGIFLAGVITAGLQTFRTLLVMAVHRAILCANQAHHLHVGREAWAPARDPHLLRPEA
jgi:hypothetical protein